MINDLDLHLIAISLGGMFIVTTANRQMFWDKLLAMTSMWTILVISID